MRAPPSMTRYALLADPERTRLAIYEHLMDAHGLEVVSVQDGPAALKAIAEKGEPVLMITELSLPKIDAFGMMERLKTSKSRPFPILAVSRFMDMRDEASRRKEELNLAGVLSTSMPVSSLERAIRGVLSGAPGTQVPLDAPVPASGLRPRPSQDPARLKAIKETGLVNDAPPDDELQKLCGEVARALGASTALVSFVLEDRQWFKAYSGLDGKLAEERSTPISQAFCKHAVDAGAPFLVPDARVNPVFADNELVTSGVVRGYAGVPLVTSSGLTLGTLCVLDRKPLEVDVGGIDTLRTLARQIAGELELRSAAAQSQPIAGLRSLQAVLDSLETGILLMDGSNRDVFYANQAAANLAGLPRSKVLEMNRDEWLKHVMTLVDNPEEVIAKLKVRPTGPFSASDELELQRPFYRVIRWTAKPIRLETGLAQMAMYSDITAQRAWERAQEKQALADELTGLGNRRTADDALVRELSRAKRYHQPMSVVVFDLDHFKKFNEVYGPNAGDEALRLVARVMVNTFRLSDTVIRWGGEEFLAILPEATLEECRDAANRVLAKMRENKMEGVPPLTLSCGVATKDGDETGEALVKRAEERLKEAKGAGRDRIAG
jgi:diguanylate cyclase (GGDEF)-like protein